MNNKCLLFTCYGIKKNVFYGISAFRRIFYMVGPDDKKKGSGSSTQKSLDSAAPNLQLCKQIRKTFLNNIIYFVQFYNEQQQFW